MQVKDAMHAGVQWVEPGTPVLQLAKLMQDHNIGAIPIGENDRLVGMVTDRDIVCRGLARGLDLKTATARDVMSKGIVYCKDSTDIGEAARLMEQNKVRRLAVINDGKRMIGMLSIGDLSRAGEHELCGEIVDAVAAKAA